MLNKKHKNKKSLRDRIREEESTIEANLETGKKIADYRSTTELTGEQIATLQNIMSYLMTEGQDLMFALSPNATSMLSTISIVQEEFKAMVKALDIKLPEGSRVSAQSLIDRAKKTIEEED